MNSLFIYWPIVLLYNKNSIFLFKPEIDEYYWIKLKNIYSHPRAEHITTAMSIKIVNQRYLRIVYFQLSRNYQPRRLGYDCDLLQMR